MAIREVQLDLFIQDSNMVNEMIVEAKNRNFTRRINHLFGELDKIKKEAIHMGMYSDKEKTP
jgi:hypothetical protein